MTQSRFHPLGVQSHYFLSWVFRIVGLQISLWHLEPQFYFISVQSHLFQFQAFRVIHFISFRHSEPCLHFSIQNHCPAWHSIPSSSFNFGVQSYRAYSFKHLESPSFLLLAFRVIFPQPYHSREPMSYQDKFGGLSYSSTKFTSFRSCIHSLYL